MGATAGIAPDGICLCADGSVWVANALGPECVRVAEGGEVLERVDHRHELLRLHAGRRRPSTLYIVTAFESHDVKARAARNGAIEKVRTSVPGAGLP